MREDVLAEVPETVSGPEEAPVILLAGYGAWALAARNPAALAVTRLARQGRPGLRLVGVEMPVETGALGARVAALLARHRPAAWIGVGLAEGAAVVRTELTGINRRHFSTPDATGARVHLQPVIPGGPAAYETDLPHEAIVARLTAAGIPAALSFHAGTHLCNQMIYTLRHMAATGGPAIPSGFLHVPQSPGNVAAAVAGGAPPVPSMELGTVAEALGLAVDCVAEALAERA